MADADARPSNWAPDPEREPDAEDIARLFHETYERLAPAFGYTTRPESAVEWDRVPEYQRALMIATVRGVWAQLRGAAPERDAAQGEE